MTEAKPPGIRLRQAVASDAQAIGAVFDAAVRVGWTYLGELASRPMFTAAEWDKDVADHASPNLMLVATDEGGRVVGFTAVHPQDCEMYLLFVDPAAAGRGVGRMLLAAADDAPSRGGLQRGLPLHPRAERARVACVRQCRLSPGRIGTGVGLPRDHNARAAPGEAPVGLQALDRLKNNA